MPLGGADWYKEQPTNRNFLNPIGFILELEKFAGVDFFNRCHLLHMISHDASMIEPLELSTFQLMEVRRP